MSFPVKRLVWRPAKWKFQENFWMNLPWFANKGYIFYPENQWKPIKSGANLRKVLLFVSWKSKVSIILRIAKHGRSERPRRTPHGTLLTNLSNSDIVTKMIFQIKPWPLSITKGKSNDGVRGFQVNFYLGAFRPNGNRFCPTKWLLPRDSGHQTTDERDSGPFSKIYFPRENFRGIFRGKFPRYFWNRKKYVLQLRKNIMRDIEHCHWSRSCQNRYCWTQTDSEKIRKRYMYDSYDISVATI